MKPSRSTAGADNALPAPVSNPDCQYEDLPVTLADVLARLEANPSCERRHLEMKSSIRRMAKVLRRSLIDTPADPAELRMLIAAATPASVGVSKANWSRIRSLTLAALRDLGVDMVPGRDIGGCSPAWRHLADQLPTRALRVGLSRFMSHCTRRVVEPQDVTVETFAEFDSALRRKSLCLTPEALYRATVRFWNKAADAVDAWPQTRLPFERHQRFYSHEWDQFPPSFVRDVEAFLRASADGDELDELDDSYVRPVKPATVALRRRQLRQLATVLVLSGLPIDRLTSLAVLAEPANAKGAIRFQRARQGGAKTTSVEQQAWLLATISRYWVKDLGQAAELRDIARRLNVKPKGMTPRNRSRLRQFDLKANQDALLHLPATVLKEAKRDKAGTPAEARRVLLATAVEFLIVAPMRVGNLTGLEHSRHILEIGRGRASNRHIIVPAEETKTDVAFEMILPADSAAVLDVYLKTYRPRVCAVPSPYLFPNADGGRRSTIPFSKAISDFIEKETGIRMHVHLFRHLAGKFHLDAHPNDLETVRQVLGHASTATTARHYAELRTDQSMQRYDQTVADLRASPDWASAGSKKHRKVSK
jgi:integrase